MIRRRKEEGREEGWPDGLWIISLSLSFSLNSLLYCSLTSTVSIKGTVGRTFKIKRYSLIRINTWVWPFNQTWWPVRRGVREEEEREEKEEREKKKKWEDLRGGDGKKNVHPLESSSRFQPSSVCSFSFVPFHTPLSFFNSLSLSLSLTSLVRFLSFNFFQDKRNSWLLIWLLLLWIFIFNSLSNFLLQFLDCHSIRKGMNWMCSKCYIIVSASLSFILFLPISFLPLFLQSLCSWEAH